MRLIYFSPVFWSSYAQRPHFMVRFFLEKVGDSVLWINPYPNRLPRLGDLRWSSELHSQGTPVCERVKVLDVSALPIEPLWGGAFINRLFCWQQVIKELTCFSKGRGPIWLAIGRPSALSLWALETLPYFCSLYDAMDDFPAFYQGLSKISMAKRELTLARSVHKILVSSSHLEKKFTPLGKTVTIPNGYPMAGLSRWNSHSIERKAVFGYVGSMGDWFDWNMVRILAESFPDAVFKLIGPCFVSPGFSLPENVKIYPPCRQDEVCKYLEEFNVGLIPFKVNNLTNSVDPIKYYEYRAMGIPVLSSSFGEMSIRRHERGVFLGATEDEILEAAKLALEFKDTNQEVLKFRKENDWSTRFEKAGLFGPA